jgi:hypothetical protein
MACTDRECSVCYGDDGVFQKLSCGHDFCSGCIKTWYLKGTGTGCPMCRAPIYFKGFHKVRERWDEDAYENKCEEVFGEALDECFAEAQEFASEFPEKWRARIFKDVIEDFIEVEKTYRFLRNVGAGPDDMQEAFEWGDYYSDRHMDKCLFLDEPPKKFASRYPIMEKSRAAATGSKRSRARQDPWFTISFYIQN